MLRFNPSADDDMERLSEYSIYKQHSYYFSLLVNYSWETVDKNNLN